MHDNNIKGNPINDIDHDNNIKTNPLNNIDIISNSPDSIRNNRFFDSGEDNDNHT